MRDGVATSSRWRTIALNAALVLISVGVAAAGIEAVAAMLSTRI